MSVSARRMTDGPGGEVRFHYLVRWRDDQRIEHARMFPAEGEAAEFDADVKAGRLEPDSRPRRPPYPTFQAEAMDWLATKQATTRAATAARYESHLRVPRLRTLRTEKRTGLRTGNGPQAGPWHHQSRSNTCNHVRRQGLEPRTRGLRVRCSAS